ncbi:MAG: cytochrome c5 family protein [Deltaproteobacteria bacterium]|jgi:cytochrome c5|nr:cytochrome c5 family protein [Deltaproteobacteria bacterium]MBW2505167.1 cytochrome c5 family protein [Deltaproteobacteria bacterium]MBW2520491.1 cytochrome c5 family protein [Deltaproteobacteria bacterium]
MKIDWITYILLCLVAISCRPQTSSQQIDGQTIYSKYCANCHDTGFQNAQVIGDKAGWQSRIAQGFEVLVSHSIDGYMGALGYMPPRGGHFGLSDREIRAAVQYIIQQSQ